MTAAMRHIKTKVLLENQIEKLNQQLMRIQQQVIDIEMSQEISETVAVVKQSNQQVQDNMRSVRPEYVDGVLNNARELHQEISNTSDALGQVDGCEDGNDEKYMAELNEMATEENPGELPTAGASSLLSSGAYDQHRVSPTDQLHLQRLLFKGLSAVCQIILACLVAWASSLEITLRS